MGMNEKPKDASLDQFAAALKRLPRPISDFGDGAACPWCGALHKTVTYGRNFCDECRHEFRFGHPEWGAGKECWTWVDFPWKEFEALGNRADLVEKWVPNLRVKGLHFQKAEERIGKEADEGNPQ